MLKDASASAVYGARAAFGVILVTTKQGEKGKPVFSYNTNVGYTTWATNTDFITSGYWNAKINDEAMYNSLGNTNTRYSEEDYAELWARVNDKTEHPDRPWVVVKPNANGQDMYRYYANFDWHDYLFLDKRPKQEHSVSVSGASDKIRYFLSGNFLSEDGMYNINTDNFGKYNFRVKVDADITDRLTISNNTQYFKSNYQWYGYSNNNPRVTDNIAVSYLYHFMPAYVPYNPDGTVTGYTGVNSYSVGYGFHAALESGKLKGNDDVYEVSSTFGLKYKLAEGLNLHANYTYLQDGSANNYRAVRVSYSKFPGVMEPYSIGALNLDRLSETMNLNHHHVYNVYGNYDVTIGNDHHIQAMAGFNQEERIYKRLFGRGDELLSETLNDLNLATGELLTMGGASEWTLRGAFYRFNYDYKGRYLFETSGRYDGTSRFGKSDRFGFFPSFSAGWLISEEPFYERLKAVNNSLKLRFSYGELGNQNVNTYAYISSMSTGRINYLVNSQTLNVMNNPAPVAPSLTWERSRTSNLGLDAEFMKSRLSFSLDVYKRETKDMLTLGKTLPKVFGAAEPKENAADLETKGFDLALGWRDNFDLGGKSFSYRIQGVLSDYTAYITRFDNPNNLLSNYYKGQKLGDMWGYHYDGFFKTTDEAQEYAASVNQDNINVRRRQAPTTELRMLQAGDIKILDLDGNGIISVGENTLENPGDRRIIGNSQPRYSYGLTLGGAWNNIDVSIFFQGIGKQNWYPHFEAQQFWHVYARPYGSFLPAGFQDMIWSEDNPNAYFPLPRGYAAQNAELRQANNMYLQDIGYLKLRNLTVGYTLPKVLTDRVKLSSLRVYFSGENLHTWTKLDTDYIDPEEVMTDPTGRTYPIGRVFSAGLQLMF